MKIEEPLKGRTVLPCIQLFQGYRLKEAVTSIILSLSYSINDSAKIFQNKLIITFAVYNFSTMVLYNLENSIAFGVSIALV